MNGAKIKPWNRSFMVGVQPNGTRLSRAFIGPLSPRWTTVVRWTILGPMMCMSLSWVLTFLIFYGAELPDDTMFRVFIASSLVPCLIAGPLFFSFTTRMRRLTVANVRLDRVANTDSLTNCLNRGAFMDATESQLLRAETGALLVIDADNFKTINDCFGHDVGDTALTLISQAVRETLRNGAIVGRMGGEEFAVFLPNSSRLNAFLVAERIRIAVRQARFSPNGTNHSLSVSIGGAWYERTTDFTELFRVADQSLYLAKNAGRNTVSIAALEGAPPNERKIA